MARQARTSVRAARMFTVAVQYAVSARKLPSRQRIRAWAKAAWLTDLQVTFRLVGSREGRALNREFRGKDRATNVLTFPYPDGEILSGDIVLCVPVIAQEARAQRKTLEAHYAHLVVHGMLHLQGYGHETSGDADIMESLEAEILAKLGYADPYDVR